MTEQLDPSCRYVDFLNRWVSNFIIPKDELDRMIEVGDLHEYLVTYVLTTFNSDTLECAFDSVESLFCLYSVMEEGHRKEVLSAQINLMLHRMDKRFPYSPN